MNVRSYIIALMYTVYIMLYSSGAFAVTGFDTPSLSASEGSLAQVPVSSDECNLVDATDCTVTLIFSINGTATSGVDYVVPVSNTITLDPFNSYIDFVNIQTIDDPYYDPNESLTITLQSCVVNSSIFNAPQSCIIDTPNATLDIIDNDPPSVVGPFETLCGTTLFADTKIENTTETIYGDCEIYIADGYKLTILNSNITVYEEFKIQGEAGSLTIKGCYFDASDITVRTESGDIIIKNNNDFYANKSYDAEISIETNSGNIAVKDNEFHIISDSETEMEFQSNTGNIEVLDNTFVSSTAGSSLKINTYSGLINFKGNTIDPIENMHVTVFGYGGGPVKIVENAGYIYDDLRLETNGADIVLVENNFDENVHSLNIDSDGGNINVVGNDIPVSDNLGVISNGGKIDIVKNNFYSPYLIVINSEGGACKTAMNNPVLTCVSP